MDNPKNKSAYFVASFYGKKDREDKYIRIAQALRDYGYIVYDDVNTITFEAAKKRSAKEIERYWKLQAVKNINKADIFVAEISEKSTAIGVEIGMAVRDYKPTLLLKAEDSGLLLPVPVVALKPRITTLLYNDSNLEKKINGWLNKIDNGFITKFMNIGFTKQEVDFIEYIQKKEEIKSFALTIRLIIDGKIDIKKELKKFK